MGKMKIKKFLMLIILLLFLLGLKPVYASNENLAENSSSISLDTSSILGEQESSLGIRDFLKEANKYASDFTSDINISDIFNMAIKGKIDNSSILKKVVSLLRNAS